MTGLREIVLDIETTGLFAHEGHRLIDIAAVELIDGKPTGKVFQTLVNPERDIPAETTKIHGIANEDVKDKPVFAAIAKELHQFVGDAPIVITCRTEANGYVLDRNFLDMEMEKAGMPKFREEQWINVRRWSEAMFGDGNARLNDVLDRYGITHEGRDAHKGHGALPDAQLLAEVYPHLKKDYFSFVQRQAAPKAFQPKPSAP